MSAKRTHSATFKMEVALAAIKGELTQAQITSKYGVHPTQINRWKKQAIESLKAGFTGILQPEKRDVEAEHLTAQLYEEIGRLKVELDWLKKKSEFKF